MEQVYTMAYKFTFDLTKLPKKLFDEINCILDKKILKKDICPISEDLVCKFNIDSLTGLSQQDAKMLIKDMIEVQLNNRSLKKYFSGKNDKALFLPHCCRKYMDSQCKASFNPETSSYACTHCSPDCLVNQATTYANKKDYDVYVLPGASCVNKILDKHSYEGIIGIACTDEIKMAAKSLLKLKIPIQTIPLLKNGCSSTTFSITHLIDLIAK
jgi:uncharacterized protein